MRWWQWLVTILIGFLMLVGPSSGHAIPPIQSNIAFGEVVEGNISEDDYRQQYTFTGRAGQVATITMETQRGTLDPYLLLVTQDGAVIAFNDDDTDTIVPARDAALRSVVLPQDGIYTIIATRFGQAHGTTTGDYTLTLDVLGTAIAPVNENDDSLLRYGDDVVGTISDEQPYVIYRLAAQRGDVINISLVRVGGNLDPQLDFFDPVGQFLINGDDDRASGSLNARIANYMIPADGVYFIQATRYGGERGTTSGLFTLEISVTPLEQLGTRPATARFLMPGTTETATLTADAATRFFRFDANRGDIVTVTVERSEGDFVPRVRLVRNDNLLQLADSATIDPEDEAVARLPGVSLTANGVYLLIVSAVEEDDVDEPTQGEFSITVSTRPGIAAAGVLEIVYDGQIFGQITETDFANRYLFVGEAGDVVTITMRRTEGDLDPLLTLLDDDNKQLIADDDGFAENSRDAQIQEFTLPADGIYYIEASRFQRAFGVTTGDYTLRLSGDTELN